MDKKWESLYDHSRERNFQAMKYRYVGSLRKIFSHLGVVQQISQWASLFECFYKAKQWKVPMLRGFTGPFPDVFSQIPFKVSSGHVQILMGWDQIICFPPRASWRTPGTFLTLRSSWQKKFIQEYQLDHSLPGRLLKPLCHNVLLEHGGLPHALHLADHLVQTKERGSFCHTDIV